MGQERATPLMTNRARAVWSDDRLQELLDAREAVKQMMTGPGWEAVQAVLDEEISKIDHELDHGPAKEQAEYAHKHGRRSALRAADDAARGIIALADTREKKAQQQEDARRAGASERQAA